jgi:hypothetical protein
MDNPKWGEDFKNTLQLFSEACVYLRYVER